MSRIISILNQKGGVGKTTTALHLAYGFALDFPDRKILLVDVDSQCNASSIFVENTSYTKENSVYGVLEKKEIHSNAVFDTGLDNLFILPSHLSLIEMENQLTTAIDGFFRLSDALKPLMNEYEYIFIDCPPNLSAITINAMVSSHDIIVPLQTSKFSIDGIRFIANAVQSVKDRYNPYLKILGALLTFFDPRTTIAAAMVPEIRKHIPVFQTYISKSVVVEEAHLMKKTLFDYAPGSKVTKQYDQLIKEIQNVYR